MLNDELFLPSGCGTHVQSAYDEDTSGLKGEAGYRPDIDPVAEYLLEATGRSPPADVGYGIGRKLPEARAPRKLGIDFGTNLSYRRATGLREVVICSDAIARLRDPRLFWQLLSPRRPQHPQYAGAGTGARTGYPGAPPNLARVHQWALDQYGAPPIECALAQHRARVEANAE